MVNDQSPFLYSKECTEFLSEICSPFIKNFPIRTFGYRRFFNDGRYLALSNNAKWQEYYFSNIHTPNTSFEKAIRGAQVNRFTYFLWPQKSQEPIFQALYAHNIWQGISIYRKKEESVECYAFASTRDMVLSNDFFNTDTLEILKKFIEYFSVKAHPFIYDCSPKALGYFEGFVIPSTGDSTSAPKEDFLTTLKGQNVSFEYKGQKIFLTPQEYKCLCALSEGNSIKQVASLLGLSARTVECYLKKIFYKSQSSRKSHLLREFNKNKSLWL